MVTDFVTCMETNRNIDGGTARGEELGEDHDTQDDNDGGPCSLYDYIVPKS